MNIPAEHSPAKLRCFLACSILFICTFCTVSCKKIHVGFCNQCQLGPNFLNARFYHKNIEKGEGDDIRFVNVYQPQPQVIASDTSLATDSRLAAPTVSPTNQPKPSPAISLMSSPKTSPVMSWTFFSDQFFTNNSTRTSIEHFKFVCSVYGLISEVQVTNLSRRTNHGGVQAILPMFQHFSSIPFRSTQNQIKFLFCVLVHWLSEFSLIQLSFQVRLLSYSKLLKLTVKKIVTTTRK